MDQISRLKRSAPSPLRPAKAPKAEAGHAPGSAFPAQTQCKILTPETRASLIASKTKFTQHNGKLCGGSHSLTLLSGDGVDAVSITDTNGNFVNIHIVYDSISGVEPIIYLGDLMYGDQVSSCQFHEAFSLAVGDPQFRAQCLEENTKPEIQTLMEHIEEQIFKEIRENRLHVELCYTLMVSTPAGNFFRSHGDTRAVGVCANSSLETSLSFCAPSLTSLYQWTTEANDDFVTTDERYAFYTPFKTDHSMYFFIKEELKKKGTPLTPLTDFLTEKYYLNRHFEANTLTIYGLESSPMFQLISAIETMITKGDFKEGSPLTQEQKDTFKNIIRALNYYKHTSDPGQYINYDGVSTAGPQSTFQTPITSSSKTPLFYILTSDGFADNMKGTSYRTDCLQALDPKKSFKTEEELIPMLLKESLKRFSKDWAQSITKENIQEKLNELATEFHIQFFKAYFNDLPSEPCSKPDDTVCYFTPNPTQSIENIKNYFQTLLDSAHADR